MSDIGDLVEEIVFAHEGDRRLTREGTAERRELEKVAALATGALARPSAAPADLSSRLAADALRFCAAAQAPLQPSPAAPAAPAAPTAPRTNGTLLAFLLGAAAAGLGVWFALAAPSEPSVAQLRAETIAGQRAFHQDWQRGPSEWSGQVEGDVVWRQEHQDGWLTFRGLPVLPEDKAYQLWIRDQGRGGQLVDGGVFTIGATDEQTLVTIRPSLAVANADAFVVTVEDRRGAIVSKQEHVVATAGL